MDNLNQEINQDTNLEANPSVASPEPPKTHEFVRDYNSIKRLLYVGTNETVPKLALFNDNDFPNVTPQEIVEKIEANGYHSKIVVIYPEQFINLFRNVLSPEEIEQFNLKLNNLNKKIDERQEKLLKLLTKHKK